MGSRRRQLGYWQILWGVVTVLTVLDVWFTVTRTFRRRRTFSPSGSTSVEVMSDYWRRIARSVGPHLLVWVVLIGGFWAIVHFGPLRPIHEWFN
jgi:hypothetical protein